MVRKRFDDIYMTDRGLPSRYHQIFFTASEINAQHGDRLLSSKPITFLLQSPD
jgi:hypothetical protein